MNVTYVNVNFIRTNFLRQLERLAEMNILLYQYESYTYLQFYWRLELNVYVNENLKHTNFLWQLERLEISVLYQYKSYAYKFIGDWDWTFTSMWILYVLIFFDSWRDWRRWILLYQYESHTYLQIYWRLGLNVYVNVNFIRTVRCSNTDSPALKPNARKMIFFAKTLNFMT